ncbi:MAG: hypothetical protein JWO86_5272 [Myxococcaceae bacterium]|jgi:hypothetical protein|nr:hypothetical protein [Myxococcaceae bacterium]MEA2752081.1 hypothetical protein [Myxococcales bacterium]
MESRFVFALAALTAIAASTSAVGCSSGADAAPAAYATESGADADESGQLRALDIAASEAIVDESDPDAASESDLEENPLTDDELAKMGAHAPRHVRSFSKTSYVVKSAIDWKQDPKKFVADNLPAWALAGVGAATAHVKPQAGDYLLRNGNVINLIYSTPGVGGASTDMVFAFGSIAGRFGWVALDAIKSAAVVADARAPALVSSLCRQTRRHGLQRHVQHVCVDLQEWTARE